MKTKLVTIRAAWIGGIFAVLAAAIPVLLTFINGEKVDNTMQNISIAGFDSSNIAVTNNQNEIHGDFVNGDKISINRVTQPENITAPEALIVTSNQSGGANTVTINQVSSQTYKPISALIISSVNASLDNLLTHYPQHPKVVIEIESGNSMREKVARDLEEFLIKGNLGYYPKGNTNIGRFSAHPISLFTNKKNLKFSTDLLKALNPYMHGITFIDTSFISTDVVRLYINGVPTFNSEGSVEIE